MSKEVLFNKKKVNLQKVKEQAKAVSVAEIETSYSNIKIDSNLDLFDELRMLRKQQAEKENVPPYVIFSDASLMELASYLPQSKVELTEISGFGAFKIEKYGDLFLKAVQDYSVKNELSSKISEKKPKKQSSPKKLNTNGAGTFTTSYSLFKAGNNVEEIAEIRSLSINTIQNHLVNFVEVGNIKPEELMDFNKIEPIITIAKAQTIPSLKAIKEELDESFSYFDINIAVAFYKCQERQKLKIELRID